MEPPQHDPGERGGRPSSEDGIVEEVAPPTIFNYSFLGSGQEEEVILRDRIPVGDWSTIGLSIRTHRYRGSAGVRFTVLVRGVNPSEDDGADFATSDLASVTVAGVAPYLQQLTVPLSDLQVPFLRVLLKAQGPTSPPGEVYCELSCDLVLKGDL